MFTRSQKKRKLDMTDETDNTPPNTDTSTPGTSNQTQPTDAGSMLGTPSRSEVTLVHHTPAITKFSGLLSLKLIQHIKYNY